jgi:hypothetical protein
VSLAMRPKAETGAGRRAAELTDPGLRLSQMERGVLERATRGKLFRGRRCRSSCGARSRSFGRRIHVTVCRVFGIVAVIPPCDKLRDT